jgi:NO-binding membrane sensor protein with MHYT domain/signal transduction histidine kinase
MSYPLSTGYNFQLVILSIAIAILASYTALDLAGRVNSTQNRAQIGWLVSGAVAMGTGIWSMHFIGMLAFRLPLTVNYDFMMVLVSVFPAILASGLALFLVSRPILGGFRLLIGGLFMGLGIASMHYLGMEAMQISADMQYNHWLVMLSILIAIAVSFVGLFLVFRLREETIPHQTQKKLLAAIIMGAAISTMHYMGMAAASFMPMPNIVVAADLQPPENGFTLAASVIIGTLIILGLALLTAFFDRRLSAQVIYTQAVQESQKYLKTIIEGVQVGVLVIEGNTQIKLSNHAVLEMLHLSTEAELQQLWKRALTSNLDPLSKIEDIQYLHSLEFIFQKIVAKQPIKNVVIDITTPAPQKPTSLLVNTVPLSLLDASVTQMVCTFSEITDLKRTENRLKESESQFRELAQQEELLNYLSTQIRQSLDLQTILQTAVCEVRKIFETDRALIYQFDANWYGQVTVEDFAQPWNPTIGEAADNCFPQEYLDFYQQGGIRAMNNILEAKLFPDHLRFLQRIQVQANLIVAIRVHDQLWGLLIVHQCGRTREWKETEKKLLNRLGIQLGIAIQQSELYNQAEQNASQALSQAQDLQQTLQQLQSLQIKLVQSEKMSSLGQLVAGIAHEINNPVNFIHGNLTYVKDYTQDLLDLVQLYQQEYPHPNLVIQTKADEIDLKFLQEDLAKTLTSMNVGTDRIRQIVLSLRNFSRMDEAEFKLVNIHEGIDSTLMILQHRLKAQSDCPAIAVIKDYGILPQVACSAGQLNQVFMNILCNAIDALEEHHAKGIDEEIKAEPSQIRIRTSVIKDTWVEIAIADNGIGITPQVQQRIFDPFFTTKPIGKGTGMGMSISYQIITEKHGGKLKCFSTLGAGTVFVIQIPICCGSQV